MWTFSTLCPSFPSGVVREVDCSQDCTRDASCTHVLHNCAVLISDRVPQVPCLPCNSESRSLSSFLKLEKCWWGPDYWTFDKEHLDGTVPSSTELSLWRSLCLEVVWALCIRGGGVLLPLGRAASDRCQLLSVKGMCSPSTCPFLLFQQEAEMFSCSQISLWDSQGPLLVRILPGKLRQTHPSAHFGASSMWLLSLGAVRSAWFQWELGAWTA